MTKLHGGTNQSGSGAGLYLQSVKQLVQGQCYISRTCEACTQTLFFAWSAGLLHTPCMMSHPLPDGACCVSQDPCPI